MELMGGEVSAGAVPPAQPRTAHRVYTPADFGRRTGRDRPAPEVANLCVARDERVLAHAQPWPLESAVKAPVSHLNLAQFLMILVRL